MEPRHDNAMKATHINTVDVVEQKMMVHSRSSISTRCLVLFNERVKEEGIPYANEVI